MNLIEIHPIAYNPFIASQAIMTAKAATAAIRIKADELKVTVILFFFFVIFILRAMPSLYRPKYERACGVPFGPLFLPY